MSNNINKVILIGRLGKDPEVRYLENGASVAKITVATTESYKDKNTGEWKDLTEWHDVVMWRWLAERAEKQLYKGALIYIEGKIKYRKWQKEGEETARRFSEIVVDNFRLLSKREGTDGGYFPSTKDEFGQAQQKTTTTSNQNTASPVVNTVEEESTDDLPF